MNTFRKTPLALRASIGLGVCAIFAFAGCMGAEEPASPAQGEQSAEAVQAINAGIFACSRSTGPASLAVHSDGTCEIIPAVLPAASRGYCVGDACPPCWQLAKEVLFCTLP